MSTSWHLLIRSASTYLNTLVSSSTSGVVYLFCKYWFQLNCKWHLKETFAFISIKGPGTNTVPSKAFTHSAIRANSYFRPKSSPSSTASLLNNSLPPSLHLGVVTTRRPSTGSLSALKIGIVGPRTISGVSYGQFGVSYSFNGCEGGDITAATSDPAEGERKHFSL